MVRQSTSWQSQAQSGVRHAVYSQLLAFVLSTDLLQPPVCKSVSVSIRCVPVCLLVCVSACFPVWLAADLTVLYPQSRCTS